MQTNIFVDKKERTGKPHELFGIWMATQKIGRAHV